jgi:protein TonB
LVVFAHIIILYSLIATNRTLPIVKESLSPMMASLVMPNTEIPSLVNKINQQKVLEHTIERAVEMLSKPVEASKDAMSKLVAEAKMKSSAEISETRSVEADSEKSTPENQTLETQHEAEQATSQIKALAIEPPRFGAAYLNNPAPDYPAASRRFSEQGIVLLRVLVSLSGQTESVQIESSSGYSRLDQAAIKAVKMWSFIPAKRNNQPLSAYVLVPVKFSLAG